MPAIAKRFDCSSKGNNSGQVIQIIGTKTGYRFAKLELSTGAYETLMDIPFNRTDPPFTNLNGCAINPLDDLAYCTVVVNETNYLARVDEERVEYVAILPQTWNNGYNNYTVRFTSGAFSRYGTYYFSSFHAVIYNVNDTSSFIGTGAWYDPRLIDLSSLTPYRISRSGGFGDMVVVHDDLMGHGEEEEFVVSVNSWNVVIARLTGAKPTHWLLGIGRSIKGLTTNFGAGWYFAGHVFFSSNHGLGVFEVPLEEVVLKDQCTGHSCYGLELSLVGESERTNNNDGLNCYGGGNPWTTNIQPFDCKKAAGIMRTYNTATGFDVMSLDLAAGNESVLFDIPFNRTQPPWTSLSSVSLNPRDSSFYGVIVVGSQPYMVRFDDITMEFVAVLPVSSGGYVGGSFSQSGAFFYTSITAVPRTYKYYRVDKLKGFPNQTAGIGEIADYSHYRGETVKETSTNKTISGMSGLVTVRSNVEGAGNEEDYMMGIDPDGNLVTTKVNCTHSETWFVKTISPVKGGFGASYTFDGKVFFEAKDGSGVYEVPLTGFDVRQSSVNLKHVGTTQKAGGTDFAGFSEDGFNCMASPSPFYSGDCQLEYHEVPAGSDGICPNNSIQMLQFGA